MAISSVVHAVRVESTDVNQKTAKTVTIADPPITSITKECVHQTNQHSLCPKCGIVSHKPTNHEKKSILICKEQSSDEAGKTQINSLNNEDLPRRFSDGITHISTIKPLKKQRQHSLTTDNIRDPNDNTKHKTVPSNKKRTVSNCKTQVQRSSSLKHPAKKTIVLQSSFKNTNSRNCDKRQSGTNVRIMPSNNNYIITCMNNPDHN